MLISILIIVIIGWIAYLFIINTMVKMVKDYEPHTFEKVFKDSLMRVKYGITNQKNPNDYGYENVEDVVFYSTLDSLKLSGWYVNSAPESKTTVLLIHGRTSNRLKTMKFLQLFKETGLDSIYNFFIPDLRNSGKSTPTSTYMGYKFAEDIHGSLSFLREKGQKKFILYGFSMGAMAICTMLDRKDLKYSNGSILKVILDSPLSDAKANVKVNAKKMGIPNFIFKNSYEIFSKEMNGYSERMAIGIQLKNIALPILIMQSNDDNETPVSLIKNQLKLLADKSNIEIWFMDGPKHVMIYTHEDYKEEYTKKVAEFLKS